MERHAVGIVDGWRVDRLREELLQIARADVAGEIANVVRLRLSLEVAGIDLTRGDDPDLDDFKLASK